MAIRLMSLSSGSRGNCLIVASDSTAIVVDAGVGVRTLAKGLRLMNAQDPYVLITHTHYDHISGLGNISKKYNPMVFCQLESFLDVKTILKGGNVKVFDGDFYVGDITVSPFCVSHDAPCVGYSFYHQGQKISVLTDLGELSEDIFYAIEGSDLVFIEANHDEDMLKNNPNYPPVLKRRIMSNRGHLSNRACCEAIKRLMSARLKQVVLAHLSQENNIPSLAIKTVNEALEKSGVRIDCALQGAFTDIFLVKGDEI